MSDLVGNPEDQFSRVAAQVLLHLHDRKSAKLQACNFVFVQKTTRFFRFKRDSSMVPISINQY